MMRILVQKIVFLFALSFSAFSLAGGKPVPHGAQVPEVKVPFEAPEHKPLVTEVIHATHFSHHLFELGVAAKHGGTSLLKVAGIGKAMTHSLTPPTPKAGAGGTFSKVLLPLAVFVTAMGATNDAIDISNQAHNKKRMKAAAEKAISELAYVMRIGGKSIEINGKVYSPQQITEIYSKMMNDLYIPDTGDARDTYIVLRNAIIPFMSNPVAENDFYSAVSLAALKHEVDALRASIEPTVRAEYQARLAKETREKKLETAKKIMADAKCVVEFVCTIGNEFEPAPRLSNKDRFSPVVRKAEIPLDLSQIESPDLFLDLVGTLPLSNNGYLGCLGFGNREYSRNTIYQSELPVHVPVLKDQKAKVSLLKLNEAIQNQCGKVDGFVTGTANRPWEGAPAEATLRKGYTREAFILQSHYRLSNFDYKWISDPYTREYYQKLKSEEYQRQQNAPKVDPLFPFKRQETPVTPSMSARHR